MKEMNSTCVGVDFGACLICMFLIKSTENKRQTTQKYRQLGLLLNI